MRGEIYSSPHCHTRGELEEDLMRDLVKSGYMVVVMLLLALALGCAGTTKQQYSGFLGDYPDFKPGKEGFDLVYIKEGINPRKYKKIMMDQVVFYLSEQAKDKGIRPEEIKELADAFYTAFIGELGDEYRFTDRPGPEVLRIRAAITGLEPSKPALTTVTTIIPTGLAISAIKKGITGEYTGVGNTSMEVEFLDSQTNERLAAGIDTYPGSKISGFTKWGSAKEAFEFWARRLRSRLDEFDTLRLIVK